MNGVSWDWETFPEYMNAIERNGIALNVSFLVPLSALRFYVLGDEAAERAATEEETRRMAQVFREAMMAGAYGFSLSLAPQHIGFQGRPLASRMASREELAALCRVMRDLNKGLSRFCRAAARPPEPRLRRVSSCSPSWPSKANGRLPFSRCSTCPAHL
jgi:N-acyl-D-aspartate/D-glutamate deacylase